MIFSYYLFIAGSHAMHATRLMLKIIGYSEEKKNSPFIYSSKGAKVPTDFFNLLWKRWGGGGREGGGGEGGRGEGRGWNRLGMETLETFLGL